MTEIKKTLLIIFFISVFCLPGEGRNIGKTRTLDFFVAEPAMETTTNSDKCDEKFIEISTDYQNQGFDEFENPDEEKVEDNAVVLDLRAAGIKPGGKIFRLGTEKTYTREKVEAFNTYYIDNELLRTKELQGRLLPSSFFSKYLTGNFDENTSVSVGQKSLTYSRDGIQSGIFSDMSSDYDTGVRFDTKIGNASFWGGFYGSSQTFENSAGAGFLTEEKSFGKHSKISAGAVAFSGNQKAGGLILKYGYKNFSLGFQPSIIQTSDVFGKKYSREFYILPEYKLTNSITLTGKFAQEQKLSQFGISYKPKALSSHDFRLNFDASFYDSNETRKQKFKVSTQFRL